MRSHPARPSALAPRTAAVLIAAMTGLAMHGCATADRSAETADTTTNTVRPVEDGNTPRRTDNGAVPHRTAAGASNSASPGLLLVLGDADTPPTAFDTGDLADDSRPERDMLTILELPVREPTTPFAGLAVSNAVQGPPGALAVTHDGRYAFIAETRSPRRPQDRAMTDLRPGSRIAAIDLADPLKPQVVSTLQLAAAPTAVAVHPSGEFIAVTTATPGAGVMLIPVREGRFSTPVAFDVVSGAISHSGAAVSPSGVDWHPSGRYLGVTIPAIDTALFLEFSPSPTDPVTGDSLPGPALAPWGNPVRVGKYPYAGRFTPDGRHFITTDLAWDTSSPGFITNTGPGSLSVVRLSDVPTTVNSPLAVAAHHVISQTPTDPSPEGLAISSDGLLVAAACLGGSAAAEVPTPGSLMLFEFDPRAGRMTRADRREIDAAPGGAAFGLDGRTLYVSAFRSLPNGVSGQSGADDEVLMLSVIGSAQNGGGVRFATAPLAVGVYPRPHALVIVPKSE